jgi:hypothetical protein
MGVESRAPQQIEEPQNPELHHDPEYSAVIQGVCDLVVSQMAVDGALVR